MPSTYSPLLRLELMATGEKSATWGDITNTNLGTLLEKGIAGTASLNVTAGNVTLTALNGADDEARCVTLLVSGTPGVSRNIVAPSSSKTYCVINGSNAAVVVKGSATSGVSLAAGERAWVAWNGADFVRIGVSTDAPTFTGTTSLSTVALAAGSVGSPSYTFTGDTNNGWWSPAADTQAWSISGAEALRLNSTGFGIGGTPLARLWVQMAASGVGVSQDADGIALIGGYTQAGGSKGLRVAGSNGLFLSANGANVNHLAINAAGNVGLGILPNANWRAGALSLQIGAFLTAWTQSNGASNLGFGLYEGGTNTFNYLTTGDAPTLYSQVSGRHIWYGAAAGTAGGSVSLSQRMELNATGDLLVPARAAIGGSSPLFGGVPLNVRAGTNQNFSVLSQGGLITLAGLTDAGVSTAMMVAGTGLQLSGNGGANTHVSVDNAGNIGVGVVPASTYGSPSLWSAGSIVAANGQFNVHSTVGANYEFVHRAASRGFDFYVNAGGTLAARLSSAGQLLAPAIHNNASGASGTTPLIASGTYTPTMTASTNVTAATANAPWHWTRVGSVVYVSGSAQITVTSASSGSGFFASIPIASNLTSSVDLNGLCTGSAGGDANGTVSGDTTNDRASMGFISGSITGVRSVFVMFSYEVK